MSIHKGQCEYCGIGHPASVDLFDTNLCISCTRLDNLEQKVDELNKKSCNCSCKKEK